MTDGEAFLLVLVLIYLSDCLVWLPPSGYALIGLWSRRHVVRRAVVQFSALRKGFAVLQPLPMFGSVFVGQAWPVSMSPEGLAPFSRENPNPGAALGSLKDACFLRWEDIASIRAEGSRLRVNRRPYADCATPGAADRLATALEAIRRLPEDRRSEAIGRLVRRSLRERRASRKARFFATATRPLRFSVSLLFVAIFFLLPYAYWRYHEEARFFLILGWVWILMWQVTIAFWLLHRRFYPGFAPDRWQHAILSILFPHYAIRSLDVLSKEFLVESHPVAIAAAVGQEADFQRLATLVDRDARHPIPLTDPAGPAGATAEAFRSLYFRPAFETLLDRCSLRVGTPEVAAPTTAECPRCGTGYAAAGLPCRDCGGLLTVSVSQR
jgi:hypothetical protein